MAGKHFRELDASSFVAFAFRIIIINWMLWISAKDTSQRRLQLSADRCKRISAIEIEMHI